MIGTEKSVSEHQELAVFVKLLRATEAVSAEVHGWLFEEKLTISQFGVLEALYHRGPMCQKELAGKILKSTGNITMVLDNLEKRELVSRQRNSCDRRFITVKLTMAGKELIERVFPAHARLIQQRMSVLSRREMVELGVLLKKLGRGNVVSNLGCHEKYHKAPKSV